MSNTISIADNMKNGEVKVNENTLVFMIDIRNSTMLNKKFDLEELSSLYQEFLNKSYSILEVNDFNNIDIQGDGIYGVCGTDTWLDNIEKCRKEIQDLMDCLFEKYNVKTTLSIRYGKEVYAAYGRKENRYKQLAFFGNTVSKCKKSISNSFKKTKIIISGSAKRLIEKSGKWSNYSDDYIHTFLGGKTINSKQYGRLWIQNWY